MVDGSVCVVVVVVVLAAATALVFHVRPELICLDDARGEREREEGKMNTKALCPVERTNGTEKEKLNGADQERRSTANISR